MSKGEVDPADPGFAIETAVDLSAGVFKFEQLTLRHRRFDGSLSRSLTRERLHIGRAVAVLPYDWRRDEVLLIEQFRVGPIGLPSGPWMIECVAGLVETGEDIDVCALRELQEEAAVEARRIESIGSFSPSPGVVKEHVDMFVADVDLSEAGGVHGLACEDEDIKVHVLKADEAFAWIDAGRIVCVNALLPLRWLQINRDALVKRWQSAAGREACS